MGKVLVWCIWWTQTLLLCLLESFSLHYIEFSCRYLGSFGSRKKFSLLSHKQHTPQSWRGKVLGIAIFHSFTGCYTTSVFQKREKLGLGSMELLPRRLHSLCCNHIEAIYTNGHTVPIRCKVVSRTCLLLATNTFIASNECVYRCRQMHLVQEMNAFSVVYKHV